MPPGANRKRFCEVCGVMGWKGAKNSQNNSTGFPRNGRCHESIRFQSIGGRFYGGPNLVWQILWQRAYCGKITEEMAFRQKARRFRQKRAGRSFLARLY